MAMNICELPIKKQIIPSEVYIKNLRNPRGMHFNSFGELLLVEAGAGETEPPFDGRLTLRDKRSMGIKSEWLTGFKSYNLQARMRRDEIMGLSDIAPTEANSFLVAYTDYVHGSKIFEVSKAGATPLFHTRGNINSLCFNKHKQSWFCVKPDSNEVLEFSRHQAERRLCKIPNLQGGEDAVPVTVIYQPSTQKLLVTLFSGERHQNPNRKGFDFKKHQGSIIAIDPINGDIQTLVTGLTLPTALCLDEQDNILVTELCSDFLEPLPPTGLPNHALHGGFKRFSGRLLKIHKSSQKVEVLATELDTPSNIAVNGQHIYISEGMGLPGRPIPTPKGIQPLTGFIRQLETANTQSSVQSQEAQMAC